VKRSIYEDPNRLMRREEDDEDGEWIKLAEMDPNSGRWTWHQRWRAFHQTPFDLWKSRR
jgi:hypothetical protein